MLRAPQWRPARTCCYLLLLLLLGGCSGDPGTGPTEVHWDRQACDRCRMVLSDRHHAAQVRVQEEGRSRVYYFDDIGCALIWLDEKPFRDAATTEIWVNDWRSGEWINARTAWFVEGQVTPMEYGLGAQTARSDGSFDLAEAKRRAFEVERRFNTHDAHLQQPGATR